MTCEMCGSTDLIKQDGVFVCQTCGCKYSVEEAKKMMVEGTVEITGTVKVDNTAAIDNYLDMARNAIDAGNNKEADDYCNKIIEMDVTNWEAWLIKGKAVGWQSTLGNNRVSETINAFSKALDNCPKDEKEVLAEECKLQLGLLHTAMLSTRMNCFQNHPSEHDVEGLKSDVNSIVITTLNFLAKANITVDAIGNVKYARIVNNGICNAWNKVYSDYKGDEGHPSDYEFKRFLEEGNCLTDALKLALVLCGKENGNKEVDDLKIQIYDNLIHMQTELMNSQSYDVSYDGGYKHYNRGLYLTEDAKNLRQNEINEWKSGIANIRMAEREIAQKQEAARQKAKQDRLEEYWNSHPEEKAKLKALEDQREFLQIKLNEMHQNINRLKNEKLKSLPSMDRREQKHREAEELKVQISKMGFFQGKEKKRLQEQLSLISSEMEALTKAIASEQAAVEAEIEPLNNQIREFENQKDAVISQIASVNAAAAEFANTESNDEKSDTSSEPTHPTVSLNSAYPNHATNSPQEKDEVDVVLIRAGAARMQAIKLIKEITGLDLKQATSIVDGSSKTIKEKITKAEAESIKQKLEGIGATVEIR